MKYTVASFIEELRFNQQVVSTYNPNQFEPAALQFALKIGFKLSYDSTTKQYTLYPPYTSGKLLNTGTYDENTRDANLRTNAFLSNQTPHFADYGSSTSYGVIDKATRRLFNLEVTLVAGVLANQQIAPALSGYYGVVELHFAGSTGTDNLQLTFQDEDDTACDGGIAGRTDIVITTAYVNSINTGIPTFKTGVDNKAIEVDISDGTGSATPTVILHGEYWYET